VTGIEANPDTIDGRPCGFEHLDGFRVVTDLHTDFGEQTIGIRFDQRQALFAQ
jgi:hypothetical protein